MKMIEICISVSMMIAMVLFIRGYFLYSLPKITFIALWMIVLIRLFIPVSLPYENPIADSVVDFTENIIRKPAGTDSSLLYGVWLAGAVIVFTVIIGSHIKTIRELQSALPVEDPYLFRWIRLHPLKRSIRVFQSDRVSSPLTYGIIKPKILLPSSMDWDNHQNLDFILTHEYTHIRHFDVLIKMLLVIALSLYWFHPLVWVMYCLFNRDVELYCDETVIKQLGQGTKASYLKVLLHTEAQRQGIILLAKNFKSHFLDERIEAVMKNKKVTGKRALLILVLLVGLIFTGFTVKFKSTPGNGNEDLPQYGEEGSTEINEYESIEDSDEVIVGYTPRE